MSTYCIIKKGSLGEVFYKIQFYESDVLIATKKVLSYRQIFGTEALQRKYVSPLKQ